MRSTYKNIRLAAISMRNRIYDAKDFDAIAFAIVKYISEVGHESVEDVVSIRRFDEELEVRYDNKYRIVAFRGTAPDDVLVLQFDNVFTRDTQEHLDKFTATFKSDYMRDIIGVLFDVLTFDCGVLEVD